MSMKKLKITAIVLDVSFLLLCIMAPFITDLMRAGGKPCFSLEMLGIICPACGGTRCVNHFFKGEFLTALKYNPIIFCGIIYFTVALLLFNIEIFAKKEWAKKIRAIMLHPIALTSAVIIYVIAGFARNFI